ncbi:hypothetical protein LTR50_005669 [Elasticomyces elasticus]|nr:hypothetical protein LTR50_005669 [Elasticomyces elasticus]
MRESFWGVFWIDVNTFSNAQSSFIALATKIGPVGEPVKTFDKAKYVLANVDQRWLLILDNADDPTFDYENYFPSGNRGAIIMTSRSPECHRHATEGWKALSGLGEDESQHLLLKAAKIPESDWAASEESAKEIAKSLGWHPLAIIHAGAYIARRCPLNQYMAEYNRQRLRLMRFFPKQAQSRHGSVYATFEASAQFLEALADEGPSDALQLLCMLSMLGYTNLPVDIFKAAWCGARLVYNEASDYEEENDSDVGRLDPWHGHQLPVFVGVQNEEWDSSRLSEAIYLLSSLSLVTKSTGGGATFLSMHPLTHAWAKERQEDKIKLRQVWVSVGCLIVLSAYDKRIWLQHGKELRPHLHAYLDLIMRDDVHTSHSLMIVRILYRCGLLLYQMRDDSRLSELMDFVLKEPKLELQTVDLDSSPLHRLQAVNLLTSGEVRLAIEVFEQVVEAQEEKLAEGHPSRHASQQELAIAYLYDYQADKAIELFEHIVELQKEKLAEDHPHRLTSQHGLALAYRSDNQVDKAVELLEQVVKVREEELAEDHPDRLASQHELAGAY